VRVLLMNIVKRMIILQPKKNFFEDLKLYKITIRLNSHPDIQGEYSAKLDIS